MAKRIGPEARIIALFTALPDDSKRIVADVIKSQTAVPRKSSKKGAKKPDTPKLPDNPEDFHAGTTLKT